MFSFTRIPAAAPFAATAALGLLAFASPSASAQNLLTNGSFETGTFTGANPQGAAAATDLLSGATSITGWTVLGGSDIVWLQTGNPYGVTPTDGIRSLDLTGYQDSPPYGGVSQTFTLVQGSTYRLSFDIGSNLQYGNTVQVRAVVGNLDQVFTFTPVASGPNQQYTTATANFIATNAATTLQLIGAAAIGNGAYIGLDNASVTLVAASTAAPEPGSVALLLTGGILLVGVVARRRAARA